ncbi:hypothetical protein C8F04DRAFT_1261349 [Mycena alexandri]|uniref:Uncharacterized protein n=1 Tax=Mycena alexandri TaxID=1745969 RepID=A0AAD6WZ90_9AGAR|nr:hypothetical protein C8F04DRAFT_1199917 [Mycena alexandri]KAJ7033008.1 hypothetical protein C8F04DRAFT_1261349 [Mycena alexandri]
MPKSKTRPSQTPPPKGRIYSRRARRHDAAFVSLDRRVLAIAVAFGVSEAEVRADREEWLSTPSWAPSRFGWELASSSGVSGWGPAPPEPTNAWGTGDGWGSTTDTASAGAPAPWEEAPTSTWETGGWGDGWGPTTATESTATPALGMDSTST